MKHPPYHLRPNKAVDRLALIEAIRHLEKIYDISEYTYYSLGGPYLEEFRDLYELYPTLKMISIEEDKETIKRQKFHLPFRTIELKEDKLKSFLTAYEPEGGKSIFWLDYTDMSYANFEDFMYLLAKVPVGSLIKITLRAESKEYFDKNNKVGSGAERFRRRFGAIMPDPSTDPPRKHNEFASLVQGMIQIAAQKALLASGVLAYQPISSFFYSDGTHMLTLTGIVCEKGKEREIRRVFKQWQFANLSWDSPREIAVPFLSVKERLHLCRHLPCKRKAGSTLHKKLGYLIEENKEETEKKLESYAKYYRCYPYFVKAVP